MFDLRSVNIIESDEIPASALELADQKRTELVEQLAEIDEIAEPFLNDSLPSTEQLATGVQLSLSNSHRFSWVPR